MSLKLRDLIRQVRACKTAAEERAVIAKESAMIRTAIREEQEHYRHRNVAKLLFMHMLGYPTHFGQLECLKLIASPHFPEKRIGYLGLMLLLSEETEVLMLATNALKNDLNADNKFVAGLALTAVGNLATADMSRDLVPEVDRHLGSHTPYLRKKACLAMSRCLVKVPEMVEDFVERVCGLLKDRSHGVLICVVQLMTQMLIGTRPPDADDEANVHHYHSSAEEEEAARADLEAKAETYEAVKAAFVALVPQLVKLLRNLLSMGYSPEHDVGGISDPFLQVQILVVLRLVGTDDADTSELMNDVLAQVATNTETSKNAGNAILYEVVQTIMAVEAEDGLRVLAVNILGRFLLNRDNNIRYVALNTLHSSVVGRDTAAVQRHRTTIVDCLKDPDVSIRQRALELIYHLVNADNVETLTAELLNYLVVCPRDHRAEICTRILRVVEKYSPNDRWRVDALITMLTIAGRECDEEVRNVAIVYVSRSSEDLRAYATHKLLKALRDDDGSQRGLLVVAIWCIGEYADLVLNDYTYTPSPRKAEVGENGEATADFTEVPVPITFMGLDPSDVVRTVEDVTKRHSCPEEVRERAVTCFAKLSDRFSSLPPGNDEVKAKLKTLVDKHRGSHGLELQLRSCEYGALMAAASGISPAAAEDDAFGGGAAVSEKTSGAARDALARMPVVDLEVVQRKQRLAATDDKGELLVEDVFASNNAEGDNGKKASTGGDSLIDLESIFGGGAPPAGDAAAVRQSTQKQNGAAAAAAATEATPPPSNDVDLLADIFSAPPASAAAPVAGMGMGASAPAPAPFDPFSAPPQQQQQGGGGMDLFNPQPTPAAAPVASGGVGAAAGGNMGDLFGGGGGGGPQVASNPEPTNPVVRAFAKDGLEIDFECAKVDGGIDPQKSLIVAKFKNTTSTPLVGMNLQCAVPKYVTMEIMPPTSTTVPPSAQMGAKQVTQTIRVTNTMLGTKKLLMKLKVAFTVQGGGKVEHMSSFSGFPEGY